MKKAIFLILLFITMVLVDCNNRQDKQKPAVKVENIAFTEEVDDQEPPPSNLKTKFKNVYAWLTAVCNENKPAKNIQTYSFGLFESSTKENILFLIGTNTYQNKNHSAVRIEFRPDELFYRLPKQNYQNLNHEQLQNKLVTEITNFLKTEKFKSSFLAKANSITVDFKGEIWKR